ncbi:PH domain-containing protein [Alteromonas sp. 14N.309.X.WAT.G.H12]|uniref:PH domain-containing protein n=1 Tax=Alteromonas sp. 14N.309.X.WAT.G.H12 TaxID=3120824 RepID=UPI002FD55FEA
MGLFDVLLGNASETDADAVYEELSPVLAETETVVSAYKLVRDLIVFTSSRMILIDKQGLTGRKVNYHSIPYKAITQFVVETAGHFDTDSELKIWISGQDSPVEIELNRNASQGVQKALATQLFG